MTCTMTRKVVASSNFLTNPHFLAVVAAQFSCGAPREGAQHGPGALLNSGLFSNIQSKSNYVTSYDCLSQENINEVHDPDVDGIKRPRTVSLAAEKISRKVYAHARQGRFVITLGGDHSIGIGTVSGTAKAIRERLARRELAVVWVDAHADINTPETSPSGRTHGMPLAFVSGLAKSRTENVFDWISDCHLINLRKLVYIGLRDVDEAEKSLIEQRGIKAFDMHDIRLHGIQTIMDQAIEYIGDAPTHISYDIDSLDPEWAPSTGFPVAAGLSLDEGIQISRRLHATGNLVAMDLVEINPLVESSKLNVTLESASLVIRNILGLGEGEDEE